VIRLASVVVEIVAFEAVETAFASASVTSFAMQRSRMASSLRLLRMRHLGRRSHIARVVRIAPSDFLANSGLTRRRVFPSAKLGTLFGRRRLLFGKSTSHAT
jgi:hypothetical protein